MKYARLFHTHTDQDPDLTNIFLDRVVREANKEGYEIVGEPTGEYHTEMVGHTYELEGEEVYIPPQMLFRAEVEVRGKEDD